MAETHRDRLVRLDKAHVWHPFTQMLEWNAATPLIIERGEGNYLVDTDGRRYLDGVSSLWVTVHGHNHPAINEAIRRQLDQVAHSTMLGLAHVPAIELAERLVGVAPAGLRHVFYSDSGSTAVEVALKQAFQYWQLKGRSDKRRFVHLAEAYHGDTLGAVAVGGIELFHHVFGPLLVETIAAPSPHPYRHPLRDPAAVSSWALDALRRLLAERSSEIAGVILEPLVQGAAGMLVHPEGYLRGVAALCKEHEVLLILDEVATGFGRTGTLFACEQEGVQPDLMCLAKGITGGYLPLAATLATDEVYEAFLAPRREFKTFFHGHTYTGNPLACAAAIASLDLFEREGTLANVRARAAQLGAALTARLGRHPHVGDIRRRGLMTGIELVADASGAPYPVEDFRGVKVCDRVRDLGVILRPLGDVVVLMPPLSITEAEVSLMVDAVATAIGDVCQ
jgi:adenosylmethionine---8-amino-7-oxononanoate aminotransferase